MNLRETLQCQRRNLLNQNLTSLNTEEKVSWTYWKTVDGISSPHRWRFFTSEPSPVWVPEMGNLSGRTEETCWGTKRHKLEMISLGSALLKLHLESMWVSSDPSPTGTQSSVQNLSEHWKFQGSWRSWSSKKVYSPEMDSVKKVGFCLSFSWFLLLTFFNFIPTYPGHIPICSSSQAPKYSPLSSAQRLKIEVILSRFTAYRNRCKIGIWNNENLRIDFLLLRSVATLWNSCSHLTLIFPFKSHSSNSILNFEYVDYRVKLLYLQLSPWLHLLCEIEQIILSLFVSFSSFESSCCSTWAPVLLQVQISHLHTRHMKFLSHEA